MNPLEKEELKKSVFNFLETQPIAVISTSNNNIPEAATIMYFIDENWNIYLITHRNSRKIANIQLNPNVALVIGTILVAHTAQIQGTAEIIVDTDERAKAITEQFMNFHKLSQNPIFSAFKDNYVIIKVTITWLRWLTFEQMTNKEIYTQIIP